MQLNKTGQQRQPLHRHTKFVHFKDTYMIEGKSLFDNFSNQDINIFQPWFNFENFFVILEYFDNCNIFDY